MSASRSASCLASRNRRALSIAGPARTASSSRLRKSPVVEAARLGSREHDQRSHRVGLARERNREAGVDEASVLPELLGVVPVADRDRPGASAVRGAEHRLASRFLEREPDRRHQRLSVEALDGDQRSVGARDRRCRLERPREHLVEIDRAPELGQRTAPPGCLPPRARGPPSAPRPSSPGACSRPRRQGPDAPRKPSGGVA